jgi:hypothetical protein
MRMNQLLNTSRDSYRHTKARGFISSSIESHVSLGTRIQPGVKLFRRNEFWRTDVLPSSDQAHGNINCRQRAVMPSRWWASKGVYSTELDRYTCICAQNLYTSRHDFRISRTKEWTFSVALCALSVSLVIRPSRVSVRRKQRSTFPSLTL